MAATIFVHCEIPYVLNQQRKEVISGAMFSMEERCKNIKHYIPIHILAQLLKG